jgi:ATP synthase protein I
VSLPPIPNALRTVLRWQVIATAALAAIAGTLAGGHGALSAVLGGIVNISASVVYAVLLAIGGTAPRGAGPALMTMLRAEAGKVLAIVVQLWVVLSTYRDIVHAAFFTTFVVTVIVFSMAFFVRDPKQ